ncbi:MAG: acetylornithine deacetylase [Alphaproteobacteria bacterium]|nr:acetylornithine deacetylase [Alphaproteobacteria bacterium]
MSPSIDCHELLARLVAFDTTSRNSNLDLIAFVQDFLDRCAINADLVSNDDGSKANLFATIGPVDRPGVVFSGHTDVVPVDDQDWSSDPFQLTVSDDRLFARGAADMKGFVAAALSMVPEIATRRLERPVHLAFSYDEEVGCKGVPSLLDHMIERLPVPPIGCIVGEPTGMRVANGHKGKAGYRCTVTGKASHSALNHQGVNAVEIAAEIIARLRQMNLDFRAHGPFSEGYEPPHCTVSTGVMNGGTALNIVPSTCSFQFEFRLMPGQDAERLLADVQDFAATTLLPAMKAIADEATIDWQELMSYPALGSDGSAEIERLASALTGTVLPTKLSFGTEAGHFASRGIPSIVCGPGHMDVAHKPDEYVEREQLNTCTAFLRDIVDDISAS